MSQFWSFYGLQIIRKEAIETLRQHRLNRRENLSQILSKSFRAKVNRKPNYGICAIDYSGSKSNKKPYFPRYIDALKELNYIKYVFLDTKDS